MKGIILIYSLCFAIAIALGEDQTSDNLISEDGFSPLVDVLSEINAGQKAVILIDIGTKLSFKDKLQNAYTNKNVSLFWVNFRKHQLPEIDSHIEIIGDTVTQLIVNLYEDNITNINNLELVCHGVGCHVAAISGRKLKQQQINDNNFLKVPIIFALDPTGLENINSPPKLQPEDANYVVVLHTTSTNIFEGNHSRLGTHDIYLNRTNLPLNCTSDDFLDEFANEQFAKLITYSSLHLTPYDFNNNEEPKEPTQQMYSMDEFLSKPGSYILNYTLPLNTVMLCSSILTSVPKFLCQFLNSMKPYDDVDIELFSPEHRQDPKKIKSHQLDELGNEFFNISWPTKFIIHGFLSGKNDIDDLAISFANDLYGAKSKPLNYVNLISINWKRGAKYLYACAHQYVEDVGKYAGTFIYNAAIAQKMNLSTVEVIGHSLGGHIAGWVGKSVHKLSGNKMSIPRIVALDPAGPCYSYANGISCLTRRPDLELKRNDANQVIVLHTNSRKWDWFSEGYWGLLGTADLFLNGGMTQKNMENIYSHTWAHVYYRFVMNMEKPLTGYTFKFADANSRLAFFDFQRREKMMQNYMNPTYRVHIFHDAPPPKLNPGEAIYVDTYSTENSASDAPLS